MDLKVAKDSKFYNDFILNLKENKNLSDFAMALLESYFMFDEVKAIIENHNELCCNRGNLRVSVNLKYDVNSVIYRDFIKPLRDTKELTGFIRYLLYNYFLHEDVKVLVKSKVGSEIFWRV